MNEILGYKVWRDVEYDDSEFFKDLSAANENCTKRLATAHIEPVYSDEASNNLNVFHERCPVYKEV